jgi:hypothetical protein
MNEMLCKEFMVKEVEEALNSIGDLKAPGPRWYAISLL